MPTTVPTRPAPERRLYWPETARLLVLVARARTLDLRAHDLVRRGAGLSDEKLLRLMRRWLAAHEAIAALLPGVKEPEHVAQVRASLGLPPASSYGRERGRDVLQ